MAPNNSSDSIENPNENLQIPGWITKDLFQEVLQNEIEGYSKITRFLPIAAIGPGENYTSTMLRVHIDIELTDGSTLPISYVVKTSIESEGTRELVDAINAFPKEKEIYESILPKYEKLYADAGKTLKFGPSCKFVKDTPEHITIIMEDLRQQKFSNVNRHEGLDMDHMTILLKKLAEFHAASAVYHEEVGPYSAELCNSFNVEGSIDLMKKFFMYSSFIDAIPKWGDCEKYISMWPKTDKLCDWLLKAAVPDINEFNVLNHGDCWSNNVMFQHNDEGRVTEAYFVDFQLTQWGTPAQDLHYLITASAHYDVRINEFDRLLKIYHEHLAENLTLLQYRKSIPSLKDIHLIMNKYSLWSFHSATSLLPAVLAEPEKDANTDNLIGDGGEHFRQKILTNSRYVRAIKQLLPWWETLGVFQF